MLEVNFSDKATKKEISLSPDPIDKEDFLQTKPLYRWLLLSLLFILALGIRIYRLSDPPLEFNSSRQYQCALMARYYYYTADPSASDWQKQLAEAQKPPNYELPLMETVSSLFYRIKGEESLWFPRLLSVLFWLAAGAGIYLLSKKLWSEAAGVFSVTVFLFLPFGIFASRSFLPDPLMIMMMVFTFLAIAYYAEKPTFTRLITTGLLAAAAIIVKPMSVFMVLLVFISLMVWQKKVRGLLFHPHLWIFIVLALGPGALYYSYGLFITKSLESQARQSFIPSLLANPAFYQGWLKNVGLVAGFGLTFLTVLALPLVYKKKTPRAFLMGLWLGYLTFSLTFNYHATTHHYYHLQFIPLVALSVGWIGALVFARLNDSRIPWKFRAAVLAVFLIALSLDGIKQVIIRRHWLENNMSFKKMVEVAEEIGQHVDHSMDCIFLDPEYGSTLKYHGWMAGQIWLNATDIAFFRRFHGLGENTVQELYVKKYAIHEPRFFIVTDLKEFDRQNDLKQFLKSTFPIAVSTSRYLIFDTTRRHE